MQSSYIHTREYQAAAKKDADDPRELTWKDPEDVLRSQRAHCSIMHNVLPFLEREIYVWVST